MGALPGPLGHGVGEVAHAVEDPDGLQASLLASRAPGAAEAAKIYNDYVIDWAKPGQGRLQPTAIVTAYSVAAAVAEAQRTIESGLRAGAKRPRSVAA